MTAATFAPRDGDSGGAAAGVAARVRALAGWRRHAAAFAAGLASVLAMAPFHLWPVLALTLPVLVWLVDARPAPRPAALAGWWFGFGFFLGGLFWIGEAFLVEAEVFAWLLPFAVTLMPAGLALFFAAALAAASRAWGRGLTRVLALAAGLGAAEWLRGHVLTGLPWNVLGYALTYPLVLLQGAALVGIYGLTLVTVVALAAPLVGWVDAREQRRSLVSALAGTEIAAGLLALCLAWGAWRLALPEPLDVAGATVRLVQPSIVQREKWRPENQERIFREHLALSRRSAAGLEDGLKGVAAVIWPEAAMPFLPLASPEALAMISELLPAGTHLISGALRVEPAPASGGTLRHLVFNSMMVFGPGGLLAALYDKIHLVPFGEYLPLQAMLEGIGLEQLTRLRGGFAAGPKPRPLLAVPGLPAIGPLVCYEAIFPGAIVQGAERPGVLVNLTNDGWFGNTTGPRQHLHQARVRAAEEGIPILRVANNGISAVIDARGGVRQQLGLDVKGVIDAVVPGALPPPPYARFGDAPFAIMLALLVTLIWARSRGSRAARR